MVEKEYTISTPSVGKAEVSGTFVVVNEGESMHKPQTEEEIRKRLEEAFEDIEHLDIYCL